MITHSNIVSAARHQRTREDEVLPSHASLEPPAKRVLTSTALVRQIIGEARIEFWRENGTWPTEEQEKTMDRFRDIVGHARAKKTFPEPQTLEHWLEYRYGPDSNSKQPTTAGSEDFMDDHNKGITAKSEKLCQTLLQAPQPLPKHTVFSDDELFKKTCKRVRGENETKVVRDIAQLIVPSAEILADQGAEHLDILRETTNACWVNSYTFINPSGSRPGPRPQPDFGLGFKRDTFSREQLQELQIYIGDPLTDSSWIAATYNMYLPFLSSEVKCGAAGLDIADRQNVHTQSVILRGLYTLFRLVGRENELHQEINGFSISYSDVDARIWGHYAIIDGKDAEFY
ncbi:hypothetical protein GQ44DRAFT_773382 [Phaeosphaeriaceae sp. PMI808]|nr:hypothetical protein GQ44DRAFT_773382 [Phaeosphaeriaceae sp. PMI808]